MANILKTGALTLTSEFLASDEAFDLATLSLHLPMAALSPKKLRSSCPLWTRQMPTPRSSPSRPPHPCVGGPLLPQLCSVTLCSHHLSWLLKLAASSSGEWRVFNSHQGPLVPLSEVCSPVNKCMSILREPGLCWVLIRQVVH